MRHATDPSRPKVLVASDFSPEADEAIRLAHEWALARSGSLIVCHVDPESQPTNFLFPQENEAQALTTVERERRAGDLLAQRVADLTGRTPDEFEISIDSGDPESVILDEAKEFGADLIVLGGTPSAGEEKQHSLGRVARHVLRSAHASVLIARSHGQSGRVLAATDLSDPSLPAVMAGASEASRRHARLTILYNIDPNPAVLPPVEMTLATSPVSPPPIGLMSIPAEELRARAQIRVRALMSEHGVTGDCLITEGYAGTEIVEAAITLNAELLVVGTHGRSGLARIAMGSVAEQVAETVRCPLLVVRLGQRSFFQ